MVFDVHWVGGMKPLLDTTAVNDDTLDLLNASVERARRREGRERRMKGPAWATAPKDLRAA